MKKRFVALFMALAVMLSMSLSTAAFAAENTDDNTNVAVDGEFVPLDESNVTREYALELLGLTEEEAEAEGVKIYVNSFDVISPRSTITISSGDSVQVDTISVSGTTKYGNIAVINGTRVCWGAGCVYTQGSASCTAELQKYSGKYFYGPLTLTPSNNQQTHSFVDITYGQRVQFKYTVPSGTNVTFVSVIGVA